MNKSQAEIEFEKWFESRYGKPNYDHPTTNELKESYIKGWYNYQKIMYQSLLPYLLGETK